MIKRVAVLVVIVAVVAMIALPVFAASQFTGSFDEDLGGVICDGVPVSGDYELSLVFHPDFGYSNQTVPVTLTATEIEEDGYVMPVVIGSFQLEYSGEVRFAEMLIMGDVPLDADNPDRLYNAVQFTSSDLGLPVVSFTLTPVSPAPIDPEPSVPGISPEEGGITAMVESVVSAIFAVFSAIGNWFVEFLPTLTAIFWTGEALTFLGVLAILGLGVSVIFLLISVIRRFMNFGR